MDLFRSTLTVKRTFKQLILLFCQKGRIMGGIFGSSPPPPPPPLPPPAPPAPTQSEAELAEKAARERRRRAQAETIATSWRGIDDGAGSSAAGAAPKRLLGE